MRFLSLFLLAAASLVNARSSFSIDAVMSAPFASALTAAPKGQRVAWILNEQGVRNIWVAEGPAWKGRKLTSFDKDDGQDVGELAWTPDGATILFTHGGDFENGGENPNPDFSPSKPDQSIWSVPFAGGQMRKLTEGRAPAVASSGDNVAFIRADHIYLMTINGQNAAAAVVGKGNPDDLRWSPDGKQLAFVTNRRDHSFIGLFTPATKTLRYVDASTASDSEIAWSRDGSSFAYVRVPAQIRSYGPRRTGEPWSIRVYNIKAQQAAEVFRAAPGPGSVYHGLASDQQIFWDSGNHLVFPWEKTGWLHLYRISSEGHEQPAELTPGDGEVEHVAQSKEGAELIYSTNIGDIDRRHIWRINPSATGKPQPVTRGGDIEWSPAPLAEGDGIAALASAFNQKSHAVLINPDGRSSALAPDAVPSAFPASDLVKPEAVTITAADGLSIHGQLFRPSTGGTARRPALIFFHGGSRRQMLLGFHYMYYYSNSYAMNQFLANQGYVVLSVNYRSGIGYGLNFREALNYGPSGGSEYADVIGAGLFLKSRPDVDPKRIGVWGGSYGGYLTALALARGSDLFAAGVDFHGVHDWSTTRNFSFSGGDPEGLEAARTAARIAFESSPMASVDTWHSPVLLIHGDDDRNVPFAQTVTLAAALQQRKVEFEELIFPNEIHDFLEHKHWVEAYQRAADFFHRHLTVSNQSPSRDGADTAEPADHRVKPSLR